MSTFTNHEIFIYDILIFDNFIATFINTKNVITFNQVFLTGEKCRFLGLVFVYTRIAVEYTRVQDDWFQPRLQKSCEKKSNGV